MTHPDIVQRLREAKPIAEKLCKACAFFDRGYPGRRSRCLRDLPNGGPDLVWGGSMKINFNSAYRERKRDKSLFLRREQCGPSGKYWKPKCVGGNHG